MCEKYFIISSWNFRILIDYSQKKINNYWKAHTVDILHFRVPKDSASHILSMIMKVESQVHKVQAFSDIPQSSIIEHMTNLEEHVLNVLSKGMVIILSWKVGSLCLNICAWIWKGICRRMGKHMQLAIQFPMELNKMKKESNLTIIKCKYATV
jgi:hypothetical protein